MAIKIFCDVCDKQIKSGELSGEFSAVSRDTFGKNKGQPILTKYLFCESCLADVRHFVAELITKKHNESV